MESLEINSLKNMIYETAYVLERKKSYLNYINVFPVKDGDTGSNLIATFNFIKKLAAKKSIKEYLREFNKLMLESAKGNSGVIMSQFYKGFCDYLAEYDNIGVYEFAKGINAGYETALNSINELVEGTMLTVLKGASLGALEVLGHSNSIIDVIKNSFAFAQEQLRQSIDRLPILKKSGVVDAGGLGVVYMLGAWLRAAGIAPKYDSNIEKMKLKNAKQKNKHKYCVNFMMIDCSNLKEMIGLLKNLGKSIEAGSNDNVSRIHLHTNDYESVKELCGAFGIIKKFRHEEMKNQ
jgi:hypothetical protein